MGSPISQVAQSTQPQGKGFQPLSMPMDQPQKNITYPGQSGQPQMGQPNQYSNTIGPWDNATIGSNGYQPMQNFAPIQQSSGKSGGKFRR